MARWHGKSKGTKLGYSIFVYILQKAGLRPAYLLLRLVALYYLLFSRKTNRVLWHYFTRRHGWGRLRSIAGIYRNYVLLGETLIDKIVVMAGIPNPITIDFTDQPYLEQMVAEGRGGLLVSAHIGNWEIAGYMLKRLNTQVSVVMYDAEHQKIKDYLQQVTGGRNMRVIVIKDDISHIYEISAALKNNGLVCIHADRFVEGSKVVKHPFLGEMASFPVGPFALASSFKVPVSFVFANKTGRTSYFFHGSKPVNYSHLPKKEQAAAMLNHFVLQMEEKVGMYPAQWFNYYDFWDA